MNGSVMPLVGIRLRLTAMLISACSPNSAIRPVAASWTKRSPVSFTRHKPAQDQEREQCHQRQAGDNAELLGGGGEDEVGMGVGQMPFLHALARAAAEQAARGDGAQRPLDLVAQRARVEEVVHALGEVRQPEIGLPERRTRRRPAAAAPRTRRARPRTAGRRRRTPTTAVMPTSGCSTSTASTGSTAAAACRQPAGARPARQQPGRRRPPRAGLTNSLGCSGKPEDRQPARGRP